MIFLKTIGILGTGNCFPKDTKVLHRLSDFHDYEMKIIKLAIEVNENQKLKIIKKYEIIYESIGRRDI